MTEYRLRGDPQLHEMVARTMLAMARGGMYDRVEGGFFRYSTTRDWSVPHFEKMSEDHAGLLRVLAGLALFAPAAEFRETLVSAVNYVRTVLYDPQTGFFAGSQDADEEYYELPLDERRERRAPFVDRTSYTNWTCGLAGALCLAARALDDDALLALALRTLDGVHERLLGPDGLVYHVLQPGGSPEVTGLFTDQVAYARALLDAHEISGQARFLERAQTLADTVIVRFGAEEADSTTACPRGTSDGSRLPIDPSSTTARSRRRCCASPLSRTSRLPRASLDVLRLYRRSSQGAGPFAATYARALQRYLSPELTVRIVAIRRANRSDFREAALRLPSPFVAIRTLPAEDGAVTACVVAAKPAGRRPAIRARCAPPTTRYVRT